MAAPRGDTSVRLIAPKWMRFCRLFSTRRSSTAVLLLLGVSVSIAAEAVAPANSPPLLSASTESPSSATSNVDPTSSDPIEPTPLGADQDIPRPVPESVSPANEPAPQVEINGVTQWAARPKVVFYGAARMTFDDNIFINSSRKESDVYFSISAGLAAGWGDLRDEVRKLAIPDFLPLIEEENAERERSYVLASYSPIATIFTSHSSENVLDHDARFKVKWALPYLALSLRSHFLQLTGPNVDIGTRVTSTIFNTEISALYDYSDRTSLESVFSGETRSYDVGLSSREWINHDWLNYQYSPKTTIGLGAKFGYLQVETGPGQRYEQMLARVAYKITEKISVVANGGVEFRQVTGDGNPTNPVFGLEVDYKPFPHTEVMISGLRQTENSAGVSFQNILSTSANFRARQRFLQRFYVGLEASYANYSYNEIGGAISSGPQRTDNSFSVRPNVRMELTKNASIELSYQYRRDRSTFSRFSFVDNQLFLQADVLF
jgi:hypothetical protein